MINIYILNKYILIKTANILRIHHNSDALFYRKIPQVIAYYLTKEAAEVFNGEIEIDESYFGKVRKGRRSRGAVGKIIVFDMLKHHSKALPWLWGNTKTKTLMNEIARKIKLDNVAYSYAYYSYDALDVSKSHHHRIDRRT